MERILLVTDRTGCFELLPGTPRQHSFAHLVAVLRRSGQFVVTTAHRSADGVYAGTAPEERRGIVLDGATLADFDQLWLLGVERGASQLTPTELASVADFMRNGLGVFATGDHEDLGRSLCGAVPRVRQMRRWDASEAPSASGVDRHQTLVPRDGQLFSSFQSDDTPQMIEPAMQPDGQVHPLLVRRDGSIIAVLPDHMHEGTCDILAGRLNADLSDAGGEPGEAEFPDGVLPVEVAYSLIGTSIRNQGDLPGDGIGSPIENKRFAAISAYEGVPGVAGRVVCAATFHHFEDTNLLGAEQFGRFGDSRDTGLAADHLAAIEEYFENIATWLGQRSSRATPIVSVRWHVRTGDDDKRSDNGVQARLTSGPESPMTLSAAGETLRDRTSKWTSDFTVADRTEVNRFAIDLVTPDPGESNNDNWILGGLTLIGEDVDGRHHILHDCVDQPTIKMGHEQSLYSQEFSRTPSSDDQQLLSEPPAGLPFVPERLELVVDIGGDGKRSSSRLSAVLDVGDLSVTIELGADESFDGHTQHRFQHSLEAEGVFAAQLADNGLTSVALDWDPDNGGGLDSRDDCDYLGLSIVAVDRRGTRHVIGVDRSEQRFEEAQTLPLTELSDDGGLVLWRTRPLMYTTRPVTAVHRDANGSTTLLCNPAEVWRSVTTSQAIAGIESGRTRYLAVGPDGDSAVISVVRGVAGSYLRTTPDGTALNNLDELPVCASGHEPAPG